MKGYLLFIFILFIFPSCHSFSNLEFEVDGVKFRMVCVKGGLFWMGGTHGQGADACPNEKTCHLDTISDFYIGETEVTQALWIAVMGSNPSRFTYDVNNPVETVSYNDVHLFITKLNTITGKEFRLPLESEWEYAAKGGLSSVDAKFAGSYYVDEVAWYKDNSKGYTHPVATKKSNELGLYDMSGNVWEWCEDRFQLYSDEIEIPNYNAQEVKYVERGGGWANVDIQVRVTFRDSDSADYKSWNGGFRLALNK